MGGGREHCHPIRGATDAARKNGISRTSAQSPEDALWCTPALWKGSGLVEEVALPHSRFNLGRTKPPALPQGQNSWRAHSWRAWASSSSPSLSHSTEILWPGRKACLKSLNCSHPQKLPNSSTTCPAPWWRC